MRCVFDSVKKDLVDNNREAKEGIELGESGMIKMAVFIIRQGRGILGQNKNYDFLLSRRTFFPNLVQIGVLVEKNEHADGHDGPVMYFYLHI